eukprot:381922-Rhodomonas_salina.3
MSVPGIAYQARRPIASCAISVPDIRGADRRVGPSNAPRTCILDLSTGHRVGSAQDDTRRTAPDT